MDETITVYSNQDLTTPVRTFDVGALEEPSDELTGAFKYLIKRAAFLNAYKHWNHDETPLLRVHDQLSNADIYLGKPSAERIRQAIAKRKENAQLL